jgi:diaminohydroxyphosphoribosylaminopyrimidine deaminase/5-amino-6-(5-phosphoribosylamino)uracil reductase
LPWVRLKMAASLDGATALQNGASQWITGEPARHDVQHWRARSCAILTGIGTVLADNPQLNVRDHAIGRQPLKVVVDSHLRLPSDAKILQDGNVLVACLDDNTPHGARLCDAGAEILVLPGPGGKVDLAALLAELARRQINELQVEAGAVLNGALLQAGLVDELLIYYAPILVGSHARGMFDFPALNAMNQRIQLDILSLDRVGHDLRLRACPKT